MLTIILSTCKADGRNSANDLRYIIVFAAALKVGYVPLFTSPRNSLDGQKFLVESTQCEIFMTTPETAPQVAAIHELIPGLKVFQLPETQDISGLSVPVPHYENRHSRDATARTLILHTSGSTGKLYDVDTRDTVVLLYLGLPKPIYLTVAGLNTTKAQSLLEPENGFEQVGRQFLADGKPMLAAAPFFHAMGIIAALRSVMCRSPIVRLPSEKMLTADLIIDVIEDIKPNSGIFPPSLLEDISATDRGIEALGKLEFVCFGGAPLGAASGDKICQVTKLVTIIGSTEAFMMCTLMPAEPDEWGYFHWAAITGTVMEPAEEDLYELVLKPRDISYQAIFHTFPGISEWRTKDLFRQHPSKPYLWKYIGRRDDIVVLSNGEKFNPVLTEKLIESHPLIKGALVVGQGRFQAGLLVEPEWNQAGSLDPSTLIEEIWPTVENANREAPAHARIYSSKIAVSGREKPFVRAAKGSIIRSQTATAFKEEIEALYSDEGYSSDLEQDFNDDAELVEKVRAVFTRSLPSFKQDTPDNVDIFSLGVDSLGVLALTNALNKTIHGAKVTAPVIYSNPSVKQIAEALSANLSNSSGQTITPLTREERMDRMARKYTQGMVREKKSIQAPNAVSKQTVVVTGSTGSLGTHILVQLLKDPGIEKVYCMNRSDNAETRQKEALKTQYQDALDFSKAEFLKTDFAVEKFGLSDETYGLLLSTVTVFIHSAWSVDFNLSLESYETTHIAGTRRAVDFAAASTHNAPIIFISSIASVGNWASLTHDDSPVPEIISSLFDNALTLPQGYGESKHVATQILATASHRLGISTSIIRAGQLAGPSTNASGAAWNVHEWLPTLVHTSKILKKLPASLGNQDRIDWVPMDVAAGTVLDIASATADVASSKYSSERTQVYHMTNPHTTSWNQIYPVIHEFYQNSGVDMQVLGYNEWVDALKEIPRDKENAERVPGLKLLEFYESLREGSGMGMPVLETSKAESVSRTLREGRAVDEEVVRKWLGQWGF